MGLLSDAAPLFEPCRAVPKAGVLLTVPALVESGVFRLAEEVYGGIGPAFYGLRTTVLAFLLMALMRIKRAEGLKEHSPRELAAEKGQESTPLPPLRGEDPIAREDRCGASAPATPRSRKWDGGAPPR